MNFIKFVLIAVAFVGFGFYSFQKGRAYERGLAAIEREEKKKKIK